MPKLSVIMPVRNIEPYVEEAVASVLCQTFCDFELLIMDDGSTDATLERVEAATGSDARVRVFARANRGLVASLNELVSLTQGSYLARMDGDDLSDPERFRLQIEQLDACPDIGVLGTWVRVFGVRNETWHFRRWDNYSRNLIVFGVTPVCHPTWMARRRLFERYAYDADFEHIEDREWLARMAASEPGLKLVSLPRVLLSHRAHDASVTATKRDLQQSLTCRIIEQYLSRHGVSLVPQELQRFLDVTFQRSVSTSEARECGQVVEKVRQEVGRVLADEFKVFPEKWLRFCAVNGFDRAFADGFVPANDFSFLPQFYTPGHA